MNTATAREIVADLANLAAEVEIAFRRAAEKPLRAACVVAVVSVTLLLHRRRRSRG